MKQFLVFLLILTPFALAEPFTGVNLDQNVSMGAYYNIDLYSNASFAVPMNCLVAFKDAYGNVVRSYTSDPNYNMIRVDMNGYVKSFVKIDDSFFVGQPYNFTVSCGNYTVERTVYIDVAGDFEPNRYLSNVAGYMNTHPEQVLFGSFLVMGVIYFVAGMYGSLK